MPPAHVCSMPIVPCNIRRSSRTTASSGILKQASVDIYANENLLYLVSVRLTIIVVLHASASRLR